MSKKPTYTMSEQELEWAEAEREHRPLYATGGHGPWMTCGCPIATIDALQSENTRLREQAKAPAGALADLFEPCKTDYSERRPVARCVYCDEPQGTHVLDCEWITSRAALRAFREANHDAG